MTAFVPLSFPAASASASAADPRESADKTAGATKPGTPCFEAAHRNGFPALLGGLMESDTEEDSGKKPAQKKEDGEAAAVLASVPSIPAPPTPAWMLPLEPAAATPAADGDTPGSPSEAMGALPASGAARTSEQPSSGLSVEELAPPEVAAEPLEGNPGVGAAPSLTPGEKPLTAGLPESNRENRSRRELTAVPMPDNAPVENLVPVAANPLQPPAEPPVPPPPAAAANSPEGGAGSIAGLPETPRTESRPLEWRGAPNTETRAPAPSLAARSTGSAGFNPNQAGLSSLPPGGIEAAAREPAHAALAFAARLTPAESSTAPQASANWPAPGGREAATAPQAPPPSRRVPALDPEALPAANQTADAAKGGGDTSKPSANATPSPARAHAPHTESPAQDGQHPASVDPAEPAVRAAPHANADAFAPAETRPAGAPPDPPAPPAPAVHRAAEMAPPPLTAAASPAREIRLQVDGGERRVDVRLTEQRGEVQVAVRTPDSQLAGALRAELPALAARLENSGFHAQIWQPAASPGQPLLRTVAAQASDTTQDFQHPGRQGGQQQPQQGAPRRPPSEANAAAPPKEFSWLLSSLG